jgi:hypothetical protein
MLRFRLECRNRYRPPSDPRHRQNSEVTACANHNFCNSPAIGNGNPFDSLQSQAAGYQICSTTKLLFARICPYASAPQVAEGVLLQRIHKVRVVPWCLMVRLCVKTFATKRKFPCQIMVKQFCHAIHILSVFS